MKHLFQWQRGRQQSGYDKMLLAGATWPFRFDLYFLKFPTDSEIAPHKDQVKSGRHFRLNIVIKEALVGGQFNCKAPIYETRRIKLFRPDISEHSVTCIEQGNRYVFSIGWILN